MSSPFSVPTGLWEPPPETVALIFDCDGTLADTMPIHYVAWVAALNEVGLQFPEEQFYAFGGMSTEKIIRILAEEQQVHGIDVAALNRRKEAMYLESLAHVRPIEVVTEVALRYHGTLPLAVGSGGERWVVEKTLDQISLLHLFDTVVGADDTERHKPEPDVYLEVARRLNVDAQRCVVFEDTDLGLEAARRANMTGVDIRPWRT